MKKDEVRDLHKNMRYRRMENVHRPELETHERIKLVNNINQEIKRQEEQKMFWKILPWVLLVLFGVWTVIVLSSGG